MILGISGKTSASTRIESNEIGNLNSLRARASYGIIDEEEKVLHFGRGANALGKIIITGIGTSPESGYVNFYSLACLGNIFIELAAKNPALVQTLNNNGDAKEFISAAIKLLAAYGLSADASAADIGETFYIIKNQTQWAEKAYVKIDGDKEALEAFETIYNTKTFKAIMLEFGIKIKAAHFTPGGSSEVKSDDGKGGMADLLAALGVDNATVGTESTSTEEELSEEEEENEGEF